MNNTYEYKNKWFWAWQDEKEEAWLSDMAREGLHLEKVSLGRYKFLKGEPDNYVYRLDYQSLRSKDKESYLQIFKDTGWEHVGEMGGWVYFRIEAKQGESPDIFSDAESKMGKYQRVMMYLVILLPIMIVIRPTSVEQYGIFSTIAEAVFAVLLLLYAYAMVQLIRRMNQVKGEKEI